MKRQAGFHTFLVEALLHMQIKADKAAKVFVMYLLWLTLSAMIFFLLLTGRTCLLTAMARYSTKGFSQSMSARLFDKIYMIIAAIAALSIIIVLERYMANAFGWKNLLLRFARALGSMLVILTVITGITQAYHRDLFRSFISALFLVGPATLGAVLIAISSVFRSKDQTGHIATPILPN